MPTRTKAAAVVEGDPAKPFLKWAGGKRQLLDSLLAHTPPREKIGTYFEPFIGGAALFFAVRPKKAVLGDVNLRLVRTYRGIQSDVEAVIAALERHKKRHGSDYFYKLREKNVNRASDAELAAWFIYLNKTGFNGLYRVNSKDRFNVPFGRYAKPNICDEENLRACSAALAGVAIVHGDFAQVVQGASRGDFAYFDPPYVPLSRTSDFTGYTSAGFGPDDQRRLRDTARALKARGVRVLLSNSSAAGVRELYGEGFTVAEVSALRSVNSKASGRGAVAELVIT